MAAVTLTTASKASLAPPAPTQHMIELATQVVDYLKSMQSSMGPHSPQDKIFEIAGWFAQFATDGARPSAEKVKRIEIDLDIYAEAPGALRRDFLRWCGYSLSGIDIIPITREEATHLQ